MTEKIGVTYWRINTVGSFTLGDHLAIYYERSDGTRTYIEAGGQFPDGITGFSSVLFQAYQEQFSTSNTDSPYGAIIAKERPEEPADLSLRRQVLLEGDDLSAKWSLIQEFKEYVNEVGFEYRSPLSQNSNAFAASALDYASVTQPGGIFYDENGYPVQYWIPGASNRLSDPVISFGTPTVAVGASQFASVFGRPFNGSPEDVQLLFDAVANGSIQANGSYVDGSSNDQYTAPFYTESGDKIVISANSSSWFASMVKNDEIERIIENNADGSRIDTSYDWNDTQPWSQETTTFDVKGFVKSIEALHDDLTKTFKEYDVENTKPWASQNIKRDALGNIIAVETINRNGTRTVEEYNRDLIQLWSRRATIFDAQGRTVGQEEQLPNGVVLRTTWSNFDSNGNPIGEPVREVVYPKVEVTGAQIGSILGSSLGQLIGGDNTFTQIAAGSALSALLGNVGQTLDLYFKDGSATNGSLADSAISAFSDFGANVASAFQSQAVGAISSFLTAELAEALGFEGTSFTDQLLRVTTGTLITSVINNVASNLQLFNGISGDPITAVASFVGSYLAKEIVQPETLGGAIGGSIGGSLGVLGAASLIGSVGSQVLASLALTEALGAASSLILGVVLPGVGLILGAFIGTLIGTLLGDAFSGLFGQPEPHWASGGAILEPGNQRFVATAVDANYGDVQAMVADLRTAATEVLNAYLDAIGGKVVADARVWVNFYSTSDWNGSGNPAESTGVGALQLAGDTAVEYAAGEFSPGGANAQFKLNYTVIKALKQTHIAGGNLYIKRAIDKSTATTLEQLSGELKIAEDYGRYLANKDLIDALIRLNPDSAFAAGWIVTLLRAEELGITQLNKTDFYGGLVPFLKSFNLERFGASLADVSVALDGNKLVITIGQGAGNAPRVVEVNNYAQMTGLTHLVASPTGALVSGDGDSELWIAVDGVNSTFTDVSQHFDTLSNDVLIGGTGNDTINAGVGADLIYGGGGNDTINAGTGDDVVTGGVGNDTIEGGAGDDVFVFNRGDGTDTISDNGVVIARDVLNYEFEPPEQGEGGGNGEEEDEPLFVPYIPSISVGTIISGGSDTLQFGRGITVEDVIVRFVGNNLVIAVKDPAHPDWGFEQLTDKIQLTNWLDTKQRVETFQFAGGTVLGVADIAFLAEAPTAGAITFSDVSWSADGLTSTTNARIVVGTDGNDTIASSDGVDIVVANGGDDTVASGAGNDYLDGGNGNDSLAGGADNDYLGGGNGNDSLDGGAGDDYLDGGDGNDSLNGRAGSDAIVGGAGTDTAVFSGNRADYVIIYSAAARTITVADQRAGAPDGTDTIVGVESVQFADQTVSVTAFDSVPTNASLTGSTVAESATNGAVIGLVTGVDPDVGSTLSYSLIDNAGGRFAINPFTGHLTVANRSLLDYESAASHAITVRVTDEAGLIFDKTFTINVTNANDAPGSATLSNSSVVENAANGTVVGTVTGSDQDAGAVLSYSLSYNAGGRFAINATTGVLTVANGSLLDYENGTSHAITVRVTDQGGLTSDKVFTINLTNVNEAPTNATLSASSIAENASNGTVVGTVTGVDQDAGATLSYSLTDDAGGRFAIDANTGQVTVANGSLLNYENATSHAITVRVTDQGGLTFDKSFTIQLGDVNESPPTDATLAGGSVAENATNGTVIGTVSGYDADGAAVLSYSLTDDAGGRFAINATTGVLTVVNGSLLNYEAATSHAITVRVTDEGGLTFDKSFTIALSNINEAPTNATLSGGLVAESSANGTVVGTITGVDPDAGATLSYSLTDNAGGRFSIDATTGQVTVANGSLLDYESAASHAITVRVTDQGGLTFDKAFTINLTNANEAPTNATLSGGTVAENSANGTVVGTVTGVDPDAGATFSYSLTDNAGGRFAINATTGELTVANGSLLNYESSTSHAITVRVTDQGGLTFDKSFTIQLGDANESPPTDATLVGDSVAENAGNGTVLGTVSGYDPDGTAVLSYSLTNNTGGRFAINASTGQLTVANGSLLDYESAASHAITVRVTDQGGLTFDKAFTINLTNANEAPTNATLSGGTIAENSANGTVVGTVAGVDPDAGATFSYSLTDNAGGRFAINASTGQLTVANGSLLNYEAATSHAITVRVTDQGGLTFDKVLAINLTNANEAPTNATLSGGSVAENSANGTVVGTVTGVDPDAGATFSYSLTDNAGGRFAINASTGLLTVANGSLLNYEAATSHAITVRVTDQGGLTFDKVLTINLTNANEAPTNATLSGSSVAENAANGMVIGTVAGVDPDAGATFSYSLTNNAGGRFAINATTGQLTVANGSLLNYESATSHAITVRVTDQGSLTFDKAFTINVTNVNEAPTNATMSGGTVSEEASNGTIVGTVTGVDPDAGAVLTYSLVSNPSVRFAINASTGVVTVANELQDGLYSITVRVTDQGGLTFDKAFTITATPGGDPVVLDLDGNGVDIVQLAASTARFDMNGDGRRDATAWAGPADGLLAIDLGRNGRPRGDGVINQTKEIIFTEWAPGATSDMAALRQVFDTNHNGKLDRHDARWGEFRIWQDRNQDGISQASELKTLDRAGIRSIDLTPAGDAIHFADGSAITGTSAYTRADGTTGIAGDAVFAYDAAGRGSDAIDACLGQLIQAMATHSSRGSGFDAGPLAPATHDASPQGALAAAWHP